MDASSPEPTEASARREEIIRRAYAAFHVDLASPPLLTLRGGDAIDSYDSPPPRDPLLDQPTDAYLGAYTFWGLAHLDPASWRHYIAHLIAYTLRHDPYPESMAAEGLLASLRPPDRDPPRLASLTLAQEAAIVAFLEELAFDQAAGGYQEDALQILEEWWLPKARYRRQPDSGIGEGSS
jgi:hypothetical protein